MSITIVKAKNGVDYITPSKSQANLEKPKGYFRVEQVSESFNADGWDTTTKKSMLFKGEIAKLEQRLANMNYNLKGCLYVEEIVESNLDNRPDLKKRVVLDSTLRDTHISEYTDEEVSAYEIALGKSGAVKRTGSKVVGYNGVELRSNGERILRFTSYDVTGLKEDTLIAYTNAEDVTAFRLAEKVAEKAEQEKAKAKVADLPVGTK
jgi:hypothetical protein